MKKLILLLILISNAAFTQKPLISFFNEQEGPALKRLFADTMLISQLQTLNAEIRMGMLDLSEERAMVIKRLNEADIPVVAWLLLPKEQGYWFHSRNADAAFTRYEEVKKWAADNQLQFSGIGIDLELDFNDLELAKNYKLKLAGILVKRLYDKEEYAASKKQYEALIDKIRQDGYSIESYYVPYIRKEAENGQTALQQVSGFLDLETDKDIPMLYTSFLGNAYGMLKVMAIDENLKQVALGSTGGGFDPTMPSMDWDALAYDMRLASQTAEELHIFCLEAAVEKGFLPKMIGFDFDLPVEAYPDQVEVVKGMEEKVMLVSDILSHPNLFLIGLFLLVALSQIVLFILFRWFYRRLSSK